MCKFLPVIHCTPNLTLLLTHSGFSVEYWRDLEMWVMGRSRSLRMAPTDRSYWSAIVSIAVSRTVFVLLDETKYRDLEIYVRVSYSRSFQVASIDRSHTNSYTSSIITMAVNILYRFRNKQDIGQKKANMLTYTPSI